MTELSADELLNRALLAILRGTADSHLELDIKPELPWPQSREVCDHFQACPEATISDVAGRDGACGNGTCNVATITMTVNCPHQAAAPAQLDTYGHLTLLLDDMHQLGQEASWADADEGEDEDG